MRPKPIPKGRALKSVAKTNRGDVSLGRLPRKHRARQDHGTPDGAGSESCAPRARAGHVQSHPADRPACSLGVAFMRGRVPDEVLDRRDRTVLDEFVKAGIDYANPWSRPASQRDLPAVQE